MDCILPNLFVPGAAKSGTTSLHTYLDQHPMIQMSEIKEPHNYAVTKYYKERKNPDFKLGYPNLFKLANVKYYGESSTIYMPCIETPQRILNDTPDARFIFILRDPIDRIISHYKWLYSQSYELLPFKEEITLWIDRKFDPDIYEKGFRYKFYLQFSQYNQHLENFLSVFPREQLFIVFSEELKADPQETMNRVFDFLSLNRIELKYRVEENRTVNKRVKMVPSYIRILKPLIPSWVKSRLSGRSKLRKIVLVEKEKSGPIIPPDAIPWLRDLLREDIDALVEQWQIPAKQNWRHYYAESQDH